MSDYRVIGLWIGHNTQEPLENGKSGTHIEILSISSYFG